MSNRILGVLEAVAKHGPATLDEISSKLPRTRSSVYRALIELERAGWIRRSINGRSFAATCKMEDLSSLQCATSHEVEPLLELIKGVFKNRKHVLHVFGHLKGKQFFLIDSNEFPHPGPSSPGDVVDLLNELVRALQTSDHLGGWRCVPSENPMECTKIINEITCRGYKFFDDFDLAAAPVLAETGELVIVLGRKKDLYKNGSAETKALFDTLIEHIEKINFTTFKRAKKRNIAAE